MYNDLLNSLSEFLKEGLNGYVIFDKDQAVKEVNVFSGSLPKKMRDTRDTTFFPAVYPICLNGTDDYEGSSVTVRIVIAMHDDSIENGHEEIYNLITKVRYLLLKSTIIGGKYTVNMPLKWSNSIDSEWPIWQGWVEFDVDVQQHLATLDDWLKHNKQGFRT